MDPRDIEQLPKEFITTYAANSVELGGINCPSPSSEILKLSPVYDAENTSPWAMDYSDQ